MVEPVERKPLGTNARAAIIADLRDWLRELTRTHDRDGRRCSPLLPSLDHTRVLTTPLDDNGRGGKPGSRPPADLGWVSHAAHVRAEAVKWDRDLRRSTVARTPEVALRAIPYLADTADDDDLRELKRSVKRWHSTACVLLGYVDRSKDTPQHYPQARCVSCERFEIYGVVSARSASCHGCGEDYGHARLLLLIRDAERGQAS